MTIRDEDVDVGVARWEYPRTAGVLHAARDQLSAFARSGGMPPEACALFELAVGELLAEIVRSDEPGDAGGFCIEAAADDTFVSVRISAHCGHEEGVRLPRPGRALRRRRRPRGARP